MADEPSTHFGFETVPEAEKAARVHGVFASVAGRYDLMNDAMSLGVHRLWKDAALDWLAPRPGMALLDVAGGTGDIAFRFLRRVKGQGHATVLDMTEDMLAEGRRRAEADPVRRRDRLGGGRRHGAALPRQRVRRLHHLLRHPERDPHPGRAVRGLPRAPPRRPPPRARVLPRPRAGAALALRPLFLQRHPAARPGAGRRPRQLPVPRRIRSGASPTRTPSPP